METNNHLVLKKNLSWIGNLRWVAVSENLLLWALSAGIIGVSAIALMHLGPLEALYVGLGHFLIIVAIVMLAPRRYCVAFLALGAVSLVNYTLITIMEIPQVRFIALVYLGIGLHMLMFIAIAWARLRKKWQDVGDYKQKDDFKWLLTQSPLALRIKVSREISRLMD